MRKNNGSRRYVSQGGVIRGVVDVDTDSVAVFCDRDLQAGKEAFYTAMEKKESRLKGALSAILDFITTFITTIVVIVAIAFVAVRLLGWEMYSVDSYSMTPAYPIDSLIVVQTVDASEIGVGDVITYVLNEEGTLVTHRVVSVDTANRTFTTKGDANSSNDASPVRWENVIGKVVLGVPYLGKPLRYLTAEENRTAVIAAIVGLLALSFLWDRLSSISRKRKEKKLAREAQEREKKLQAGEAAEDGGRKTASAIAGKQVKEAVNAVAEEQESEAASTVAGEQEKGTISEEQEKKRAGAETELRKDEERTKEE